jgi:uncharacterized protein (TIGR03067 family)
MSRRWCLVVVVLAALAVPTLALAVDDESKEKGDWNIVSCVRDGKEVPADELKGVVITLTGTNYTVKRGDQVLEEGTYKCDKTKTPNWIERTPTSGDNKGKAFLGICEEKGTNTMTVCWGTPGGERPMEFSSKSGSGHVLETVQRAAK